MQFFKLAVEVCFLTLSVGFVGLLGEFSGRAGQRWHCTQTHSSPPYVLADGPSARL